MTYPELYEVLPLARQPDRVVRVPGSKSITNRALILAALAEPHRGVAESVLENALRAEDTEVMTAALCQLGIGIEADWASGRLTIPCTPRATWASQADFFCGNSGTTIRFLTAMLATGRGSYRLDGVARMRERPIGDLITALQTLGVNAQSELGNGCPPVIIHSDGLHGGAVRMRGDVSSQYLSALLLAAPRATGSLTIHIDGDLVSTPYVDMTVAMMQSWGAGVAVSADKRSFTVSPGPYQAVHYEIEPDASSASYLWAAAAITGGRIAVPGLRSSCQGDVTFRDVLLRMGCTAPDSDSIQGHRLHGIDVDMNAISDTVMTLAVVALFAEGPTRIRKVAHIRHKETDRLGALATELRKVGAAVVELPDGLDIVPRQLHGAVLETYQDHRMAMSLSLIGLRVPGIVIRDPGCVAKTFPSFWQVLEKLRE